MATDIALNPFHITETTRFTVEADHELTQSLKRYVEFYRQAYGERVKETDLLREMARQFMLQDRKFQSFATGRRRPRGKQSATPKAPTASEGGLAFGSGES